MKKLFIAAIFFVGFNCLAQKTNKIAEQSFTWASDNLTINPETNIVEFTGNVDFKDEFLKIENADKAVYDKSTNEIVISGLNNFTFDGAVELADLTKPNTLRYKIGEQVVFLE